MALSNDCSRRAHEIPIIVLGAPFDLYHLTARNTPEHLEELLKDEDPVYDLLSKLPENAFLTDLQHSKYFSAHYYHPLYYTLNPSDPSNVWLHYQTFKPLILFDGRNYDKYEARELIDCLDREPFLQRCIDGWLIQDDPHDPWHEILLFSPINVVDPHFDEIKYTPREIRDFKQLVGQMGGFPYGEEEAETIERDISRHGHLRVEGDRCEIVFSS